MLLNFDSTFSYEVHIGNFTQDGVPYEPDTYNIMSFSKDHCKTRLTTGQFEKCFYHIENDVVLSDILYENNQQYSLPNAPSNLTWFQQGQSPNLSWSSSTDDDIAGYLIYRNLHGCGSDCGTYSYIGYTLGNFSNFFVDKDLIVQRRFNLNTAYYIVKSYTNNHNIISNQSNITDVPTNMAEKNIIVNNSFELNKNYPNPFNSSTEIQFYVEESGIDVNLVIYNVIGELILYKSFENLNTGNHLFNWDSKTNPSGIYIFKLQSGKKVKVSKGLLVK